MLAVQPYADEHVRDLAVRAAGGAGHHDPHLIGEAAWLETARRAKLRCELPRNHAAKAGIGGGNDLATEVRLLANTSKNLPIIPARRRQAKGADAVRTSR